MRIFAILSLLLLTGCSSLQEYMKDREGYCSGEFDWSKVPICGLKRECSTTLANGTECKMEYNK